MPVHLRLIVWPFLAVAIAQTCLAQAQNPAANGRSAALVRSSAAQRAAEGPIVLHAAQRGAPYLFLGDGHKVAMQFVGDAEGAAALNGHRAQALSLASADFDEDGVPDLAAGYSDGGGGIVAIYRGNVAALWPPGGVLNAGEEPAFLPQARTITLPEAPDFLGAGDFNADGHWDLVAARRGGSSLYFLRGDGRGGFADAEKIDLPGSVTALATGEVNRADGLTDIVVGVNGGAAAGSQVLVFESPNGALRGKPEVFVMPAPVTGLALAQFDGGPWYDIAAAAGNQLIVIHGRDRKLSQSLSVRKTVASAKLTAETLPFSIQAVAGGGFSGANAGLAVLDENGAVHFYDHVVEQDDEPTSLGTSSAKTGHRFPAFGSGPVTPLQAAWQAARKSLMVPANFKGAEWVQTGQVDLPAGSGSSQTKLLTGHLSASPLDDLLVLDGAANKVHVFSSAATARRAASDNSGGEMSVQLLASLDATAAPLAALPMRLTAYPLQSLILMTSADAEPAVADPVNPAILVVTNTNDSGPGSLREAMTDANNLDSTGGTFGFASIVFDIPASDPNYNASTGVFTITPVMEDNPGLGSYLPLLETIVVLDGYTQPGASPNTQTQGDDAKILIRIDGSKATMIGEATYTFDSPGSTIRGIDFTNWNAAAGTTSSGPNYATYTSALETGGAGAYIEGNFFGIDPSGTIALPNLIGVFANGAPVLVGAENTIGGTFPSARNIFSGNGTATTSGAGYGIVITKYGSGTAVMGNYIGTDPTGTRIFGNGSGIYTVGANTLGGTAAGAGNLISGNADNVTITNQQTTGEGPGLSTVIQGNFIGTDVTGTKSLGDTVTQGGQTAGNVGVLITDLGTENNTVGGTTPAARNIISGNAGSGVGLSDTATDNLVEGNYIGTDPTGAIAVPNSEGIAIGVTEGVANSGPAHANPIGGSVPGAANVISGNTEFGIEIVGSYQGNYGFEGTTIQGNLIGTDASGVNPLGNGSDGVYLIDTATANLIGGLMPGDGNVIAFNGGNGVRIDPGAPQSTGESAENDVLQNTIFSNQGSGVLVSSGTENQISSNSIYSNGALGIALGSNGPNLNTNCNSSNTGPNDLENAPVLIAGTGDTIVSATATDPNGNTSQFSNAASAASGSTFTISGSLNALANTKYTIEFFSNTQADPSGYGQGQTFLGSTTVQTDSSCNATFNTPINTSETDVSLTMPNSNGYNILAGGGARGYVYNAVITNNGPITAHDVTYTNTLPTQVAVASITISDGSCSISGNVVTCSIGTMEVNATVTVVISVEGITLGNGVADDTGTVTETETDSNPANNTVNLTGTTAYEIPFINGISPQYISAGSPDTTVNIYGTGFVTGVTTATVNNTAVTITGAVLTNQACPGGGTCQSMQATVPASLLATAGAYPVVLTNPAPGGGASSSDQLAVNLNVYAPCTYSVSPNGTVDVGAAASYLDFTVTTGSDCPWGIVSNTSFIVPDTTGGTAITQLFGSGELDMIVKLNTGDARSGTVTVAGQTVTVDQAAGVACQDVVNPTIEFYTATGGTGSVAVEPNPASCPWTASSDSSFLTITTGASGNYAGQLYYAVAADPGAARTGHILVGSQIFTIIQSGTGNPAPAVYFTQPGNAAVGSGTLTLTVNGTNFISGSQVNFGGTAEATTYVNPSQLTAIIPASALATAESVAVTVTSPGPGGGTSNSVAFTVSVSSTNNPVPSISTILPGSATAGSGGFTLTVNGMNFVTTSQVTFNGVAENTTFVSANQLTATINASDIATVGSVPVTVVNPAPGGGTSNSAMFTINAVMNNPVPAITLLAPASATAGSAGFTLTVTGSNFVNGAVVNFNSVAEPTTYVSATEVTATIPATAIAGADTAPVTVTNPTPGGGTSDSLNFTINPPATPQAALSAGSVTFPSTVVNTTTAAMSVMLSNSGDATLTNIAISITGTNMGQFALTTGSNACGTTLAAGSSCSIYVTFTPAATTSYSATLQVSDNAPGSPQTASLGGVGIAATATPTFTVSSTTAPQTVQPGGSAQFSMTIDAQNGTFPGTVTLTASGLPTGATATFSPASVSPGSSSATSQLTIQTAATTARLERHGVSWPLTAAVLPLFGLCFAGARRRRWLLLRLLALTSLGAITTLSGCGGGFGLGASLPSPQSYTITVTGTSGSVQESTTLQLTVE